MIGRRAALFVAAAALMGCPSSWGFGGGIYGMKETSLGVLVVDPTDGQPSSDSLAALTDARIVCEGCPEPNVPVDARGHFFVGLGTSYSAPPKIVLHVTAPHRHPIDLVISRAPHDSAVGYSSLVIVMKPEATSALRPAAP